MKTISIKDARNKKNIFKCYDCYCKFDKIQELYTHIEEEHKSMIPDGIGIKRYYFNRKYKKTKGSCVIDKKETLWNEDKVKYERYCSDSCKKIARERFTKNCLETLGTDNPAATVEHQLKTIQGRGYSGYYEFKDGVKVGYSSSYEKDFLRFLEEDMKFDSSEVVQCEIPFEFEFDNKKRFHLPDYYLVGYNLLIQIKTFQNMNSHVQSTGKTRQKLSDKAIIDSGKYNYIMILDKEYSNFITVIELIKNKSLSENSGGTEKIICIPEY